MSTIDACQGDEASFVIVCAIRANGAGEWGFMDDACRLNVALTRAEDGIMIIANGKMCRHAAGSQLSLLAEWALSANLRVQCARPGRAGSRRSLDEDLAFRQRALRDADIQDNGTQEERARLLEERKQRARDKQVCDASTGTPWATTCSPLVLLSCLTRPCSQSCTTCWPCTRASAVQGTPPPSCLSTAGSYLATRGSSLT